MTINPALEQFFVTRVPLDGRDHEIRLRVPSTKADLTLLPPADFRHHAELEQGATRLWVAALVESIDGAPVSREVRHALADNTAARAVVFSHREALLDALRFEGRIFLHCPHCPRGEVEIDLLGLAAGLRVDLWPLSEPDGFPAAPSVATLWPRGSRPSGSIVAARVRVALPSRRAGLDGPHSIAEFGQPITADMDAHAWRRWGHDGQPLVANKEYWRYSNPGFRAILRLSLALSRLDNVAEISPDMIEALPVCDALFVDSAYHMLTNVNVMDHAACTVTCPACRGRFLAVR